MTKRLQTLGFYTLCASLLGVAGLAGPLAQAAPNPEAFAAAQAFRVVLDPGHGGNDAGAASASLLEKDLNLSLALKLKQKLEAQRIQVVLTRSQDQEILLKERVELANQARPDCLVSLHLSEPREAQPAYELLYHKPSGQALAEVLNASLSSQLPAGSESPLHWGNLYMLREVGVPAVLVSGNFMALTRPEAQDKLVEGLAGGVVRYAQAQARID